MEPITKEKIEALQELMKLLTHLDEEIAQAEQAAEEQEESQVAVPVVATINSIIARNLKMLDENKKELAIEDLLNLAKLSHVIKLHN